MAPRPKATAPPAPSGPTGPTTTEQLTGATNAQEFPSRETDDRAQEDNRRRIQEAKEADAERQMLPEQRKALDDGSVRMTSDAGTVIHAPQHLADRMKARGFKASK